MRLLDLNDRGEFLLAAGYTDTGGKRVALVRAMLIQRPLLLIPGIIGSFAQTGVDPSEEIERWVMTRGLPPEFHRIDPLANVYRNLIATLESTAAGYKLYTDGNEYADLFLVPYDWRLPVAPADSNFDGMLQNLSATELTDGVYRYGVDYLAAAAKRTKWFGKRNTTWRVDAVDVITHSMGGLLARSYAQSAGYGIAALPKIANLVTIAAPYQGASKPFNGWDNNLIAETVYRMFFAPMAGFAYRKLLQGIPIRHSTDSSLDIEYADILVNGDPDPKKFLRLYVPSVQDVIATYPFLIELGTTTPKTINTDPLYADSRNNLLLDLNAGFGAGGTGNPLQFASKVLQTTVLFGTDQDTLTVTQARVGDAIEVGQDIRPFREPAGQARDGKGEVLRGRRP